MKALLKYLTLPLAVLLIGFFAACGDEDEDVTTDTGVADTGVADTGTDTGAPTFATLAFEVDDTAAQTYTGGQLVWKGSYYHDPATNEIFHSPDWAGGAGPYPLLYDDGPISEGGHESEGSVAGDHILSVQVLFDSSADSGTPCPDDASTNCWNFEYGLENELGSWLWTGNNGTFSVEVGSTDTYGVTGATIAGFGNQDFKLNFDTANMNDAFALTDSGGNPRAWDPDNDTLQIKGSFSGWNTNQDLVDDTSGGETADDGIYTFIYTDNLLAHAGPLESGTAIEFTFLVNGAEYEVAGDGVFDGVTAFSADVPDPDDGSRTWRAETITVVGDTGSGNDSIEVGE